MLLPRPPSWRISLYSFSWRLRFSSTQFLMFKLTISMINLQAKAKKKHQEISECLVASKPSRIHIYRKAGSKLDRDFVIVDGDLFDHTADEGFAVFDLTFSIEQDIMIRKNRTTASLNIQLYI